MEEKDYELFVKHCVTNRHPDLVVTAKTDDTGGRATSHDAVVINNRHDQRGFTFNTGCHEHRFVMSQSSKAVSNNINTKELTSAFRLATPSKAKRSSSSMLGRFLNMRTNIFFLEVGVVEH
jgi:hypothetical protein